MSVEIKYKGNTIASASAQTTKTIKTAGKYCEADIIVENTPDGGITPSGSVTLTEEDTYDVTDKAQAIVDFSATRANLAEAVTAKGVDTLPTSSFDTIATNIGLISGGGSLPTSISKIEGGSFTLASDTQGTMYDISHSLGVAPKQIVVWTDEESLRNSTEEQAQRYLISAQLICREFISGTTNYSVQPLFQYRNTTGTSSTTGSWLTSAQAQIYISAVRFNITVGSVYYKAGVEYKWVAFV